jgi:AcrR family transcriptional regulator
VDAKRDDGPSRLGLRERKQVKTRGLLQAEALRLFREQGYAETSVNDIAEAAEVSPSTFYRYFPTKVDVVLYDAFDPILIEALRAQPSELSPIGAVRAAMTSVLGSSSDAWATQMQERSDLMVSIPELRRGMLEALLASVEPFAQVLGERVGRAPDDFGVRNVVAAVIGVGLFAWLDAGGRAHDFLARIDAALAHLEAGLPLTNLGSG